MFRKIIQCDFFRVMLVQILLYSCQFHSLPAHRYALRTPGLLHQQCEQSPQLLIDPHISYVIRRSCQIIEVSEQPGKRSNVLRMEHRPTATLLIFLIHCRKRWRIHPLQGQLTFVLYMQPHDFSESKLEFLN